jgi:hypothetical protein
MLIYILSVKSIVVAILETSGLDPEITICKIVVLPVKLCPLLLKKIFLAFISAVP